MKIPFSAGRIFFRWLVVLGLVYAISAACRMPVSITLGKAALTATSPAPTASLTPTVTVSPRPPTLTRPPVLATRTATTVHLLLPTTGASPLPTLTPKNAAASLPAAAADAGDRAVLTAQEPANLTVFAPNEEFLTAWMVRNSGSTTWDKNYHFVFAGGEFLTGASKYSMPALRPGESGELILWLKAPPDIGIYTTRWRLTNPMGAAFLEVSLTFKVKVHP